MGATTAASEARQVVPLATGWHFMQAAGLHGVETADFDDSQWSRVSVPHTWNRVGNEGLERSPQSNNVQGLGWYRLRFKAPAGAAKGSRYFLQFDAVSTIADVWVNGQYLGKHEGAFARFRQPRRRGRGARRRGQPARRQD